MKRNLSLKKQAMLIAKPDKKNDSPGSRDFTSQLLQQSASGWLYFKPVIKLKRIQDLIRRMFSDVYYGIKHYANTSHWFRLHMKQFLKCLFTLNVTSWFIKLILNLYKMIIKKCPNGFRQILFATHWCHMPTFITQ